MSNNPAWPDVQGIQGTVKRCKAEGYKISEYSIRKAIEAGAIPCRTVGNAYYVYFPNVVRWLTCADGQDNTPPVENVNGIRPVAERI